MSKKRVLLDRYQVVPQWWEEELLRRAFDTACEAHKGMTREYVEERTPYIEHPLNVARMVWDGYPLLSAHPKTCRALWEARGSFQDFFHTSYASPAVMEAAYLHDVIEDTDETAESLLEKGFSETTVALVLELTNPTTPGFKDNPTLVRQHYRSMSLEARLIKLADSTDNLLSIGNWAEESKLKYLKRVGILLEEAVKPCVSNLHRTKVKYVGAEVASSTLYQKLSTLHSLMLGKWEWLERKDS